MVPKVQQVFKAHKVTLDLKVLLGLREIKVYPVPKVLEVPKARKAM